MIEDHRDHRHHLLGIVFRIGAVSIQGYEPVRAAFQKADVMEHDAKTVLEEHLV